MFLVEAQHFVCPDVPLHFGEQLNTQMLQNCSSKFMTFPHGHHELAMSNSLSKQNTPDQSISGAMHMSCPKTVLTWGLFA